MAKRYVKPARFGPLKPNFIGAWRRAAGLSEDDLAAAMETSKSTVWRTEVGKQAYTQDFLEAAAAVLGCQPWDLIMRQPNSVDDEWRQQWDEIRAELRGAEKNQAIAHLRAIIAARSGG